MFGKLISFLSGGIGGKIVDKALSFLPDKMTDEEKTKIGMAITQATREYELELLNVANEQDKEFNQRIKDLEGTASDLSQFGFIGKIVVFLRGMQRPVWGFSVLFMDIMVFSGKWNLAKLATVVGGVTVGINIESAFWIINFLVLTFLFGERAVKNVAPLIKDFIKN